MSSLGTACDHPKNSHEIIAGQTEDGTFRGRKTAEYPTDMCSAIAHLISPLCQSQAIIFDLDSATSLVPQKGLNDFPISYEDGGGLPSQPDWSRPYRQESDVLKALRQSWMSRIFEQKLHYIFLRFLESGETSPPFSEDDIQPFRDSLSEFLASNQQDVSWDIRDDQPLHLSILQQLSRVMMDADTTLFQALQDGVSTGFDGDITPSSCFPTAAAT